MSNSKRVTGGKAVEWVVNEEGCWPCVSHGTNSEGYPVKKVNGRSEYLHRLLYCERNGAIPVGMVVAHTCPDRTCLNPAHLVLKSEAERANGRSARGVRNGRTKLTEEAVRDIRASAEPPSVLAKRYGVDPSLIPRIRNRLIWSHVPD